MPRSQHDDEAPESIINVGHMERLASLLGGGVLTFMGLRRPGLAGGAMALAGGALAARGLTGYCPVYGAMGVGRREERDAAFPAEDVEPGRHRWSRHPGDIYAGPEEKEPVDEMSQQSFPASDPPSYTPGVAR